tara:strand:+ start:45 stop:389 length:345 start_codon:yes stop_codon:yes gene_type:complete
MKNVKAYRTIGEISELFKIQPHILRFWEKSFNQIKPIKRKGGRRLYSEEDIKIIRTIKKLINEEGYTVKGVKKYLSKNKLDKIKNDGVIKISEDLDIKLNQINEYLIKARNVLK